MLAQVLAQTPTTEPAPPSASSPGRTAALVAVGVGVPVVGVGVGALVALPGVAECDARGGRLCGLNLMLGMLVGGAVGLVLMPFALWLTGSLLSAPARPGAEPASGNGGGLVGALIGLGGGLAVGIGLVALGTLLHQSAPVGEVVLMVSGGVVALAGPIVGYFVGKSFASSPTPQVGLLPLRDGALVTVGAAF